MYHIALIFFINFVSHHLQLHTLEKLELLKNSHFKKIELSDFIYVIDKDGYIGDSTKLEIEYAKSLGKDIVYYSDGEFYE